MQKMIFSILLCVFTSACADIDKISYELDARYEYRGDYPSSALQHMVIGDLDFTVSESGQELISGMECLSLRCNTGKQVEVLIPEGFVLLNAYDQNEVSQLRLRRADHTYGLPFKNAEFLVLFIDGNTLYKIWPISKNDHFIKRNIEENGNLNFDSLEYDLISKWKVTEYIQCTSPKAHDENLEYYRSMHDFCRESPELGGYVVDTLVDEKLHFIPLSEDNELLIYYSLFWGGFVKNIWE